MKGRGLAKPKSVELRQFNNYLEEVRAQVTEYYRRLRPEKKLITAYLRKNCWLGTVKEEYTTQMKEVP